MSSAQDARDTRDVVTYLYGVVQHTQHMQNMYDSGARVSNVALHPKVMTFRKADTSIEFLSLKNPLDPT